MKVFISGGCKSGKSALAEKIALGLRARSGRPLYYLATMRPADGEDRARVKRHRENRAGLGFQTLEISENISEARRLCDVSGVFLLDSVTALYANEMFTERGIASRIFSKIADELEELINGVGGIVVVSDYIYSDAAFYGEYTELFRQGLAAIDSRCAKACDAVIEVCCGIPVVYKGAPALVGLC